MFLQEHNDDDDDGGTVRIMRIHTYNTNARETDKTVTKRGGHRLCPNRGHIVNTSVKV